MEHRDPDKPTRPTRRIPASTLNAGRVRVTTMKMADRQATSRVINHKPDGDYFSWNKYKNVKKVLLQRG